MNPCILVFGMPRSGSTWIGKLFDSHPDTLYRHEPDSVRKLGMPLFPDKADAAHYRNALEQFMAALPLMRSPEVVGKQPLFPKSYQSATALGVYRASVIAAKAVSRVRRHFPCVYRSTGGRNARARLVWKSIESPGRLGACIEALPDACAIHLMRHPCGYVASVLGGEAAGRFGNLTRSADDRWLLKMLLDTPTGKTHGISVGDIKRLTPEEQLTWRWVLTHEKILADCAGCERVLTIRYEDVCFAPFAMTQRMFEFAGLDWPLQTEKFIAASTGTADADYYSVFKRPQAAAQRWRSALEPPVIERILGVLRGTSLHRFYEDGALTPLAVGEAAT